MTDLKKLPPEKLAEGELLLAQLHACQNEYAWDSAFDKLGEWMAHSADAIFPTLRAAVNAVPELLALREEVVRLREALEAIFAERPAITDGLSQFQWECIRSIARAALNQEPGQ